MKRLLIVAHAPSTNTRAMLDAVLRGAASDDVEGVEAREATSAEAYRPNACPS